MRRASIALLAILSFTSSAVAAADLDLRMANEISLEPLTTAKAWRLDPSATNVHRKLWLVQRTIQLAGLRAETRPDGRIGVKADGIDSKTLLWTRPKGAWYHSIQEFPCAKGSPSTAPAWFSDSQSTLKAAQAAASAWEKLLSEHRTEISLILKRIAVNSEDAAIKAAKVLFDNWRRMLDAEWRSRADALARSAEAKDLVARAREAKVCDHGSTLKAPAPELLMEAPGKSRELLVRAPARRWNGLYSVRATLNIGARKLVGQFLIDSGLKKSIVSGSWIRAQGVQPALIEQLGLMPLRIETTSVLRNTLGKPAVVDSIEVSGLTLPLSEVLVAETDLFGPPENASTCCDGILGSDFLMRYAVEFREGTPYEVLLYSPDGFNGGADRFWVEASIVSGKGPLTASSCELTGRGMKFGAIRWDTASESRLEVPASRPKASQPAWKVSCLGTDVIDGLDADLTDSRAGAIPILGADLLARGSIVLDLGNGRVWLPRKPVNSEFKKNRTGLSLQTRMKDGDRQIVVSADHAASMLKRGTQIQKIDGLDAFTLDDWEIERRLAGVFGPSVELSWIARHEMQTVKIPTR